jgi:hypothetical protein
MVQCHPCLHHGTGSGSVSVCDPGGAGREGPEAGALSLGVQGWRPTEPFRTFLYQSSCASRSPLWYASFLISSYRCHLRPITGRSSVIGHSDLVGPRVSDGAWVLGRRRGFKEVLVPERHLPEGWNAVSDRWRRCALLPRCSRGEIFGAAV